MGDINLTSTTGFVQTDFEAIKDVLQDGGVNAVLFQSNQYRETFTAGENLVAGNVCYLKSDGKMWKADSDAESTSSSMIVMALATINADASGQFLISGRYTTSGLTAGSKYFISGTAGAITTTAPSAASSVVRIVGYALSTTVLYFMPDTAYVVN